MCALEVEPVKTLEIKFPCHRHKQKLLIHALLQCSQLNLDKIASILNISSVTLNNVYHGSDYLKAEQSCGLAQLFFICFGD